MADNAIDRAKRTAQQVGDVAGRGWQQIKQTPANARDVKEGLEKIAPDAGSGSTWYDVKAGLNQKLAEAEGTWRGYIQPKLRDLMRQMQRTISK